MGRKGVSKRKPKKSGSNDKNNHGSSNARPGESSSPVQALVNTRAVPNSASGSSKKNQKGR